jgi:hypothetical protein
MRTSLLRSLALALALVLVCAPAAAKNRKAAKALVLVLYEYSGAIRWGDFDRASDYLDPKLRIEHPISDIDRARYKQIEVTHYEVTGESKTDTTDDRQVAISFVNRHTQTERSISYHEHWEWDEAHKSWWLTTGLPDITANDEDQ